MHIFISVHYICACSASNIQFYGQVNRALRFIKWFDIMYTLHFTRVWGRTFDDVNYIKNYTCMYNVLRPHKCQIITRASARCIHCTTYRRKMSAGYFTLSGNYETALAFQFNIVAALDAGVLVYKKDTLSLTYANTDVWFSQFLHRFSFKNFKYLTFVSFFKYLLQNFIVVVVVFIFLLWLKMNNKNSP